MTPLTKKEFRKKIIIALCSNSSIKIAGYNMEDNNTDLIIKQADSIVNALQKEDDENERSTSNEKRFEKSFR